MSFDTLAPYYRWMEIILAGKALHRCRTGFLDDIPTPQNILLAGEGHGRCLVECCRRFPNVRITCLDASEKMLDQARRQLRCHNLESTCVEFIRADVLSWIPTGKAYDLIVTHFFLDCFRAQQLEQFIPRLAAAATPDANWLIADFQTPPAGLKRLRSRLILWMLYVFFRVLTRLSAKKLTAPDSFLECAGFTLHRRAESEWGLLHSDWWQRERSTVRNVERAQKIVAVRRTPQNLTKAAHL